ncbi:MAG: hypothetical protein ACXABK_00180 [Candidatus Heimdallarchaeaceae archaeon]|jgi:hypothetical protein
MNALRLLRRIHISNKRGGPILEEILLIGVAIFIFAIIFGLLLSLIGWAEGEMGEFFNWDW